MAFDLLFIGGPDLRSLPPEERRTMLAAPLKDRPYDSLGSSGDVEATKARRCSGKPAR
jgi:ATP-dependent DNA ligase